MVLWQLDTGQKQTLPHLSAAIESLVVSPSGSSYAVRLADNSAMVLSTAELQPTVSVSGIQTPVSKSTAMVAPHIPTVGALYRGPSTTQRLPASINQSKPSHLLLAVPASSASRLGAASTSNAAYLQTFDVNSSSQLSKQALTRTKITDLNMGPESNIIEEPSVTLLQISQDSTWLATVDEWMPPKSDVSFAAINDTSNVEEQRARLEVYLKFWSWNDESQSWALVSRMDSPHMAISSSSSIGEVFDLVSDPSTTGFATMGDDDMVRIWRPKNRYRNGVQVRGKYGKVLTSWSCHSVISIEYLGIGMKPEIGNPSGKLCFSADGSLLVAGRQISSRSLLHLIDTDTSTIRYVWPNMFSGVLVDLGIIDRYLVILSNDLTVWDLVNDRFHYGFALHSYGFSTSKRTAATHLAIDQQNKTFAVALPEIDQTVGIFTKVRAQIAVFDPSSPKPLFTTSLPQTATALLPATHRKGYYAIDSGAEIRILTPRVQLDKKHVTPTDSPKEAPVLSGLENIYGKGPTVRVQHETEDDDVPVVRPQQLAEIFDVGPSFALPPVTELFEQVAGLFSKKRLRRV